MTDSDLIKATVFLRLPKWRTMKTTVRLLAIPEIGSEIAMDGVVGRVITWRQCIIPGYRAFSVDIEPIEDMDEKKILNLTLLGWKMVSDRKTVFPEEQQLPVIPQEGHETSYER